MLIGCPAPPRPSPPGVQERRISPEATPAPAEQSQAFAQAEALRTVGQYPQALQAFTVFVRRYPSGPLTDDALLASGELATTLGREEVARSAYRALIDAFPRSEHLPSAYLGLGLTAYRVGDYENSQTALQHALALALPTAGQAIAHYYLGDIAFTQQRYPDALTALKRAADTSTDADLVRQAQTAIRRLVDHHLSLSDLEGLAVQYADTYPGDLLLSRLAHAYREAGNQEGERSALQRFIDAFRRHPEAPAAQARLQELETLGSTDWTKLGVLLPLSGEGGAAGQRALWGIQLALTVLQERDPTLHLSLVVRNSHGNSAVAKEALRSLVTETRVIAVIGPLFSQVATNLAPLADQLAVPVISPYARGSHFPSLSPYAFRNSITDAMQGQFLAEYARLVLNLKRFAILYPQDTYGIALKDAFIEHVVRLQGEVVAVASYAPEATDFSAPIKRIGGMDDDTLRQRLPDQPSSQPGALPPPRPVLPKTYDALFIPGYYNEVGLIAPQLAFYNLTGIQLIGSDGWNHPALINLGERFIEGAIFVDGFFAASPSPLVQAFVERFQSRYHEAPGLLSAQAYDTLLMCAEVLKAGAKTRLQFRDGLLRIRDFPGVSGLTTMGAQGEAAKTLAVLTIQQQQMRQLNTPLPPGM